MNSQRSEYLWRQIQNHARLFFSAEVELSLSSADISFEPLDKALSVHKLAIIIPTDIPLPESIDTPYRVEFNGTELTLWNRVEYSLSDEWKAIPNSDTPLWYQHQSGTLIPAWNMFAILMDLLTFGEERRDSQRDSHGRFVGGYSPRDTQKMLEVPVFNEVVAALVAAVAGLKNDRAPQLHLQGLLKPPVAVLSHDCDILLGNDFWTQIVRAYRVFLPLRRLCLPAMANLWWIIRNYLSPRRFYYDNIAGMIELERSFGFTSTFYFLNGTYGRYGARSGTKILKELVQTIPKEWELGIHYNYDTYLSQEKFQSQLSELVDIIPKAIESGRAHYLRFDTEKSFKFLESFGLLVDESAGYPDRIGYRNGVGGCVAAYDTNAFDTNALDTNEDKALAIYSVPLNVMEATLVSQYGEDSIAVFKKLVRHTACIGGALSILVHPGQFNNPEHPQMLGLYHRMLQELRAVNAISKTALTLAKELA